MHLSDLFRRCLHHLRRGPAHPIAFWGNAAVAGLVTATLSGWLLGIAVLAGVAAGLAFFFRGDVAVAVGQQFGRLAVSLGLSSAILFFLAVVTLLATGIATFAIMAGSGFDFDAAGADADAWDAAMAAYQATPGWQLAVAIFLFGLAVFLAAVARTAPVIAASVTENRIVALESFNWTRRQGVRHFIGALAVFAVPVALMMLASLPVTAPIALGVQALAVVAAIYGWCCLSAASYDLLRPDQGKINPTA